WASAATLTSHPRDLAEKLRSSPAWADARPWRRVGIKVGSSKKLHLCRYTHKRYKVGRIRLIGSCRRVAGAAGLTGVDSAAWAAEQDEQTTPVENDVRRANTRGR